MSNAEKYGAPPLAVRVRGLGDRVCIDVEDSGAGVPLDFRERLFDEFSRAEGAEVPGTGLGLFVVRSLAEAQGGTATYVPGPSAARCSRLAPARGLRARGLLLRDLVLGQGLALPRGRPGRPCRSRRRTA